MKKFEFRLQDVLKVRRMQEKIAQKEFSKVYFKHQKEVNTLRNLYDMVKDTVNALKIKEQKGFNQIEYRAHMDYIGKLNLDIDLQRINVSKSEREVEKERVKLLEAVKKRKILENLREKKLEEYTYELNLDEQKLLDDAATRMFVSSTE